MILAAQSSTNEQDKRDLARELQQAARTLRAEAEEQLEHIDALHVKFGASQPPQSCSETLQVRSACHLCITLARHCLIETSGPGSAAC